MDDNDERKREGRTNETQNSNSGDMTCTKYAS